MKRIELIVVILGCLSLAFSAQAARPDRGMVEGQILDARTGERLPGANVQILNTLLGASADLHGKFRIRSIRPGKYTLKFSMIGYEPLLREGVTVAAGRSSSLAVKLNQTVLGMNPVVVTASKRRQDLTLTPHSISVVSGTEINERQPVRLDEALQTVSGVQFVENSISIRGSSGYTKGIGSRVLLLIDGVPLMLADTGEINWNLLPIMGIEQVEVIKGAGSALYGSNALGGVINVITRAPTREGNVQVRTMFGLYDQPYYPEWKWTNKPLYFYQIQAGVGKTFQFQPLPKAVKYLLLPFWLWPWQADVEDLGLQFTVNQEQSTGYREQNAFSQYNFVLRSDHIFSDGAKFTMYGGFSYEDREEFIEWENANKPLNISYWWDGRETRFRTLDAYLMYRKPLSSTAALRFRVSFISSLMADQYERSSDYQPANGTGGEVTFDWLPHPKHSLTGGIEVKTDGGHTKFIGNRRGWSVSPYFQDEWRLSKKLTITPGFRYDSYQIQDTNFQEDQFSPKFGLNYVLGPKTAFRASAGSSFRAASVTERFISAKFTYFPIIPNENLKAETAWSFDLGLNHHVMKNWFLDVAFFHNRYRNFIEPIEEMDDHFNVFVQFRNITDAKVTGVEFSTRSDWWHNRLGLRANVTWMDAIDLSTDKFLSYRPRFQGTLTPIVRFGAAEIHGDYRYTSRYDEVKLYDLDARVPQHIINLRLLYYWQRFQFMLTLNNATNYHYVQLERNLGTVRHLKFTLNYDL